MSHTQQSKQNSQSEFKYWFEKNNYPAEWLSEKSKKIIKKLKMKNKILLLLLLPITIFAQNDYKIATDIINSLREFDVVEPIDNDSLLNNEARDWAEHLAEEVKMGYGIYESDSDNYDIALMRPTWVADKHYSEAIWTFLIHSDDQMYYRRKMVNQYATAVGFGHAYVDDKIIVVFKFRADE